MFSKPLILFYALLFLTLNLYAQEETRKNKVSLIIGHTYIPAGVDSEGKKSWSMLPSWGLDYDYLLTEEWGIGLHADMVIENFEIEDADHIIKSRSRPLSLVLCVSRKFGSIFLYL